MFQSTEKELHILIEYIAVTVFVKKKWYWIEKAGGPKAPRRQTSHSRFDFLSVKYLDEYLRSICIECKQHIMFKIMPALHGLL